jgi:hypothetical protein
MRQTPGTFPLSLIFKVRDYLEHLHSIERDRFVPPSLSRAQSVEHAAAMVERFNQLFIRNLRALNDLRRRAPAVTIHQAGQVNVGAQQVNLAVDGLAIAECADPQVEASEPKPRRKKPLSPS